MKNILAIIFSFSAFFFAFTQNAYAIVLPDFGSCLNPLVSASQINSGTDHGVVGSNKPYSGTDTIYRLSDGNLIQCLCQDNGDGIQTIWFKVSSYSQEDILFLQSQGWIYVPTGTSWGLDDAPYMAKNGNYACKGSSNNSSSSSNSSTSTTTGSVLGLATTGNAVLMYGLILAGLLSLFAGLFLKKATK